MVETVLEGATLLGLILAMIGFIVLFVSTKLKDELWQLIGYVIVMSGFVFQLLPPTYALFILP